MCCLALEVNWFPVLFFVEPLGASTFSKEVKPGGESRIRMANSFLHRERKSLGLIRPLTGSLL